VDVIHGLDHLDHSTRPVFVVVGVFDGLHLGHVYLLDRLVAGASERRARPVVITFDHHPDEILTGKAPPLLCDPDERLERLAAAGVDTTVVVHFDQRLRETTYEAFVDRIARRAPLSGFLMTPDAAFGYQRAGTPEALAGLGRRMGFAVDVVPPFLVEGRPVSSTQVRAAIEAGDLEAAFRMLGRHHGVVGSASAGDGGSVVRFAIPVALPPAGTYLVRPGSAVGGFGGGPTDREPTDAALTVIAAADRPTADVVEARVGGGAVTLPRVTIAGPVRLAFIERAASDADEPGGTRNSM
jgi:riboflavin kinase / FMN adenylyltransferase